MLMLSTKLSRQGPEDVAEVSKMPIAGQFVGQLSLAKPEGRVFEPSDWEYHGLRAASERVLIMGGLIVIACPAPPARIIIGQGLDPSNE
jgi:hypothetical protein